MAENRRFMNFFIMQGLLYDLTLVAQFDTFYKTFAQKASKIGHQSIYSLPVFVEYQAKSQDFGFCRASAQFCNVGSPVPMNPARIGVVFETLLLDHL